MPEPRCAYCGTKTGLRLYHDTGGYVPQDYICEACFTPTDTGPCFDDLPPVPVVPSAPPSMSAADRAANVKLQRDLIRKITTAKGE